ncbi:hypothetical protein ISX56_31085 [Serratia ureilytica]|nr:hypothetical protein [Serratia ureilytica]
MVETSPPTSITNANNTANVCSAKAETSTTCLTRLLKQLVALLLVAFRAGKVGGARAANINAVCLRVIADFTVMRFSALFHALDKLGQLIQSGHRFSWRRGKRH